MFIVLTMYNSHDNYTVKKIQKYKYISNMVFRFDNSIYVVLPPIDNLKYI